ncbi:amidohydrolase [bacterium]|nr:amidohydrolase [bacterium]
MRSYRYTHASCAVCTLQETPLSAHDVAREAFRWPETAGAANDDAPAAPVLRPGPGDEIAALITAGGAALPADSPRIGGGGPGGPSGPRKGRRLVIRSATVIDGTGAPPIGPMDIAVEGGRIVEARAVGYPHAPITMPRPAAGDLEIDATDCFVLPGFVDSHVHVGFPQQARHGPVAPTEYIYKLWLAHGVTSVREVGSVNGLQWTIEQARQAESGAIAAPHITPYALFPLPEYFHKTPAQAVEWVQSVASVGAKGVKFLGAQPGAMQAALGEARKLGLRTACHHAQMSVARMNVLDTAGWGLTSMEHWYGLPEALFTDRTLQDYPPNYNYNNEQDRFSEAGRLWAQAAEPGSTRWREVLERLLAIDFTLVPTFVAYEAARDEQRARRLEWHDQYTWPGVWEFFQPNRDAHGSFHYYWSTQHEIQWRRNYHRWMAFVNDYKNLGGRVCAGSDSGFIYNLYGFGFIRELELLQEAGFHPLESIRAATLKGAQLMGREHEVGTIEVGKRADLVILDRNPLANTKALYGTGAVWLNDETQRVKRTGGVCHTVVGGAVYDAKTLLAEVRDIVEAEKERRAGAQR